MMQDTRPMITLARPDSPFGMYMMTECVLLMFFCSAFIDSSRLEKSDSCSVDGTRIPGSVLL